MERVSVREQRLFAFVGQLEELAHLVVDLLLHAAVLVRQFRMPLLKCTLLVPLHFLLGEGDADLAILCDHYLDLRRHLVRLRHLPQQSLSPLVVVALAADQALVLLELAQMLLELGQLALDLHVCIPELLWEQRLGTGRSGFFAAGPCLRCVEIRHLHRVK